jgi:hypothetical protein
MIILSALHAVIGNLETVSAGATAARNLHLEGIHPLPFGTVRIMSIKIGVIIPRVIPTSILINQFVEP